MVCYKYANGMGLSYLCRRFPLLPPPRSPWITPALMLSCTPVYATKTRLMKHSAIYVKTDKGTQEVQTRATQLPRRARSLLIMVDGHSTAMEILSNTSSIGETSDFFRL